MSSSITCLSDSTTRLIVSHVVIVTPALLVKELIDNAIDAKATSVEILVSPDTISKVEIQDNGLGIHPNDFNALGKPSHTSKLKNIEDLGSIVGKSLGFRGEALASANSMADITITTKTSTEPIASIFQLIPNEGGILTQKQTSAPVGTTVSITNLFSRHPVRKKVAVKEAKKTLNEIQKLLRSYVMAQPQLKILFKVIKAPAKTWSYSPSRNPTLIEAALQLFGAEVTSNCLSKTLEISPSNTNSDYSAQELSTPTTDKFLFEVLLANPDASLQKVPKYHYFSVDGRPISAVRGVAKRLLNIYLEHLKRSTLVKDISDCFIRLNIRCPPGSYDANIEPSKDDVLFSDEQIILDAFRRLCDDLYKPDLVVHQGTLSTVNTQMNDIPTISDQNQLHRAHNSQTQPDLLGCARKATHNPQQTPPEVSQYERNHSVNQASIPKESICDKESPKNRTSTSISFTPINGASLPSCSQPTGTSDKQSKPFSVPNSLKVDMSVDLNEHSERSRRQRPQVAREPPCPQGTRTSGEHNTGDRLNPWVIAKMSNSVEVSPDAALGCAPGSPATPEPPVLRHIMAPPGDLDFPSNHQNIEHLSLSSFQRPTVPGGPYRSPLSSPLKRNLPWTPPSSLEKNRYTDVSQVESARSPPADGFKQTQISFGGPRSSRRRGGAQGDASQAQVHSRRLLSELEINSNLNMQDIFSAAKKNLHYQISQMGDDKEIEMAKNGDSQQHRRELSRQRQPFGVLQTNTFNNSKTPGDDREPIATTLPTGDPRAYLLRRQKSMAAEESGTKPKKLRRLKSSLLPLENTSPEFRIHMLSSTVSISGLALKRLVRRITKYDEYVMYGTLIDGLEMSLSEGRVVESRLQKLLAEQKENIGHEDTESETIIVDLQAKLKGKGALDERLI
ncbi:hypothetical protein GQX73_g4607 [Xylaria multiplex]|uniref:DNA mismatch repair protein S5 domain-containing protein n=1 Tax=Xylaria multiplex TaxID=323545 RepID=A0A7C8MTD5_9PEZI|nr:hypothetical protein GQX73_g4607 [Xylaria multiplex]